jgi:hypothetical protein
VNAARLVPPAAAAYIGTMFIETETTPNPSSRKFLPGREVMATGTREFTSPKRPRRARWLRPCSTRAK